MGASEQSNLVQSALLKTGGSNVSKKIRNAELDLLENGAWNNDIADLAPALLVAQPQWPKDWLLRITDLTESAAQTYDFGTERASIVHEIERIALPETGLPHYRVVKRGPAGKTIEAVPADGNCFFASVLNVLGEGGRRRLGIPSADNATQIIHLREMLAKHLVEHHTEYEPFVADVPPEVISEAAVIDWQPKNPDHFGIQIKAMPWYVNVLEHLSMEDLDLVDRIERIAFSQESRREIERWVRPLLTPMGGAERGEIQAAALVNFLKIADAAHDTYQIWPTEIAGRVFQTLAVVAHQTAPTERDAVMAAYQEIGNAYDRSPLLQHVVQYRTDHLEADIREFLTNRNAQVELMRVLDLADRHGDVALQLIVARLHERPQGSKLMAILDSWVDEATERRIEAVAELREDFVGEGDPVPAMLAERLKSRLPGQSFGAVYDELGSSRTREALERNRDERVDEENNDWTLAGKELSQLAQQQMDGRSLPVVKPLRVRNAVEGAVAGLYALNPVPVLKFLEQAESGYVYLQTLAEYKDWKRDKAWRTLNDSIDAYDKCSANWQGGTRFNWLRGQVSDLTDIEDSDRPILPGVNTETRNRQRREDTASGPAQHPPVDKQTRGGRARMFAAAMDPESQAPYGWSALTEPLSLANGADGAGGSGGDEESGLLDRDTQASPTPEWMLAQLMAKSRLPEAAPVQSARRGSGTSQQGLLHAGSGVASPSAGHAGTSSGTWSAAPAASAGGSASHALRSETSAVQSGARSGDISQQVLARGGDGAPTLSSPGTGSSGFTPSAPPVSAVGHLSHVPPTEAPSVHSGVRSGDINQQVLAGGSGGGTQGASTVSASGSPPHAPRSETPPAQSGGHHDDASQRALTHTKSNASEGADSGVGSPVSPISPISPVSPVDPADEPRDAQGLIQEDAALVAAAEPPPDASLDEVSARGFWVERRTASSTGEAPQDKQDQAPS